MTEKVLQAHGDKIYTGMNFQTYDSKTETSKTRRWLEIGVNLDFFFSFCFPVIHR